MGVSKNNQTVEVLGSGGKVLRGCIPDFFRNGHVVGDVKDVAEQSLDVQMRDIVRVSKGDNVRLRGTKKLLGATNRFDLIVRAPSDAHPEGTHVTEPLQAALAECGGGVYHLL